MICPRCAEAGDLLPLLDTTTDAQTVQQMIDAYADVGLKVKGQVRTMIYIFHSECRGGTWCDCQHKILERVAA